MKLKKLFTHTVVAASMFGLGIVPNASAAEQPERDLQPEYVGLGSGAIAGAVVGGPIGAFAGALVGALVGQSVSYEDLTEEQHLALNEANARNSELELISQKYNETQLELARLRSEQYDRQFDLDLELTVQFRTGSAEIEPHFMVQLDELAGLILQAPNVSWQLSGYADPRGNEEYNLQLSQRRVQAVHDYLISVGVPQKQLSQTAFGDQMPLASDGTNESFFFDRRVSLKSMPMQQTAHTE